jgi:predicted nucleic acid-binding Zn ribbon protein
MSVVMDRQPSEPGIVLTKEQTRRRRARSIAIALALAVFVVLIFAVTLVKGPGVLIRPL